MTVVPVRQCEVTAGPFMTGQRRSAGDGGRQHESDSLTEFVGTGDRGDPAAARLDELRPRYAGPIADPPWLHGTAGYECSAGA